MIRGYCDVCSKWATEGQIMPCVDNPDTSPPATCGLLKEHEQVVVEDRPTSFDDAKARLIEQAQAAEPPMWAEPGTPLAWSYGAPEGTEPQTFEEFEEEMFGSQKDAKETFRSLVVDYEASLNTPAPDSLEAAADAFMPSLLAEPVEGPVVSDGGSSSYYDLPDDASELNDLIEHKDMGFARGNIFKACYRLDEKAGTDALYDVNKIIYFANRMKMAIERGNHV